MAEGNSSFQDKTEPATPKRKEDARKKGNVAKSMEVNSAVVIGLSLMAFWMMGGMIVRQIEGAMNHLWSLPAELQITQDQVQSVFIYMISVVARAVGPFMLVILVGGLLANIMQVGFLISGESIKPDMNKLDVVKGFQNIFSRRSLEELIKNFLKIIFVGLVAWWVVRHELPGFFWLGDQGEAGMLSMVAASTLKLLVWTTLVILIIAFFDWAFQNWDHAQKLKMTKQEVKDERKQTEGDPQLKSRIRSTQMEMAFKRMMQDVPKADVIITNPTHLAIALSYKPDQMSAPVVLAKGARLVAERIKALAGEHNVPQVENKPLARAMFPLVEVGMEVPLEFYQAIAEILAQIYRNNTEWQTV